MAIKGLYDFIQKYKDVVISNRLHDTYLAVDGNNLVDSLYCWSSRQKKDYLYGGNYNHFAKSVKHFFESLSKCGITPIVVMGGGIDPSQQTLKKIIEGFRKDLKDAKKTSEAKVNWRRQPNEPKHKPKPTLYRTVFLQIMSELDIKHIQCFFGADSFVAKIANQMKCPVLSDDTNFLVIDITFGVISPALLLKSFVIKTNMDDINEYKYLDSDLYKTDNFIGYYPGLKKEVLPLFGSLFGPTNNWLKPQVFDYIIDRITDPIGDCKHLQNLHHLHHGKKQRQMNRLLNWLCGKTIEEAIYHLISVLKCNELDFIKRSLDYYSIRLSDEDIEKPLDLNNLSKYVPNRDPSLPQWFVDEYHKCSQSATLMTVIKLKSEILTPRVEDFSMESSYTCGLQLRQYLFALLRNDDKDMTPIRLYDRFRSELRVYELEPLLMTPNTHKTLPHFHHIREISFDERKSLIFDILYLDESDVKEIEDLFQTPDSLGAAFLVISLRYWIRKCDYRIPKEFIYSILTSIVFSGYIGRYNRVKFFKEFTKYWKGIKNFYHFDDRPNHSREDPYLPKVVHFYTEFQDCLKNIRRINLLLGRPLEMGEPFFCLNGHFIYNLTLKLSEETDPIQYLNDSFGSQTTIPMLFKSLLSFVTNGFKSKKFIDGLDETNVKNPSKRQQTRPGKVVTSLKSNDNKPYNRFSTLAIDEIYGVFYCN